MSEYILSQIRPTDRRGLLQMDALLEKEGIERDKNLDYTVGLFDEDYNLVGTGSCFGNTLRCLAVSSDHQGEGLLNQIITHLTDYQYQRGHLHLFLYTKCNTARFFGDLGFYEIARVDQKVVFMENRKNGFENYLEQLQKETKAAGYNTDHQEITGAPKKTGAVILNANPFTLGHQYLLEQAAAQCDLLHVFVVSEDVSLVPFAIRHRLVLEGSAHLANLVCHQTGPYMISGATFPSYFLKDSETVIRSHASLDIAVFTRIAQALKITGRFVGEEPFSQVTGIYNQVMAESLKEAGIHCHIIPRKADEDGVISASAVRQMIRERRILDIQNKVPESTYRYFTSPEAKSLLKRIQEAEDVVHY